MVFWAQSTTRDCIRAAIYIHTQCLNSLQNNVHKAMFWDTEWRAQWLNVKTHTLIVEKQVHEWRAYPDCTKSYMSEEHALFLEKVTSEKHTLIAEKKLYLWTAYPDCREKKLHEWTAEWLECSKHIPIVEKQLHSEQQNDWMFKTHADCRKKKLHKWTAEWLDVQNTNWL